MTMPGDIRAADALLQYEAALRRILLTNEFPNATPGYRLESFAVGATEMVMQYASEYNDTDKIAFAKQVDEVRRRITAEMSAKGIIELPVEPAIELMERIGGGFVKALAAAWRKDDLENRAILQRAFAIIFNGYRQRASTKGVSFERATQQDSAATARIF